MRKNRIKRGDIWMADLLCSGGDVLCGSHPVIVVSSDLMNRNSGIVTVVPLTSSAKPPMRCHVKVSGFGLKKQSTALVEQLTTIPKNCLCFWVGSLTDSEKLEELEQAVRQQLDVA